jgi:hypothetical protein
MGGDDSQKLLPRRGRLILLRGAANLWHCEISTLTQIPEVPRHSFLGCTIPGKAYFPEK